MAEEPKVTPIIRLPQIRAERGEPSSKAPGFFLEPAKKGTEAGAGEHDTEEAWTDDPEFQFPMKSQISGDQPKFSGEPSGLRGVSTMLRRALLNFAEQERQRTKMVTILVAVQAALLLAALPGNLLGQFQLAGVLVTLGGLALFGFVRLLNWMGRTGEAAFLLVLGGVALVVLDLLLSASHQVSLETLHISLLFVLVILSSGILFSPETALILSIISAIFTALVLLLFHPSGTLAAVFNDQGLYLSLIYLVLVQVAVGVVAWLFGRQMQESVHLITYVSGLSMSNKRLQKRLRETGDQKRHLEAGIAIIQQTHARVAAGDYSARAHVEGELLPLSVSLNLMLERVESFVHGEHERERMETAVAGLAELAGQVGEEGQSRLPAPTGTALDGLSIAIKQMQTNVNQRLAKVQQSTTVLMATVGRCQDGLLPVAEVLQEHLRSIDALVIAADNIMNSAQRQVEYATQAEQMLLTAAPESIVLKPVDENGQLHLGTSALRLAEDMERRATLVSKSELSQEVLAPVAVPAPAVPEAQSSLSEEAAAPEEPKTEVGATSLPEEQPAEEPAPAPEGQTAAEEPAPPPAQTAEAAAKESAGGAVASQPGETPETVLAEAPAEQTEATSAPDSAVAEVTVEEKKVTLAAVDREAAEEAAQFHVPDWNIGQLRELVGVLGNLAGEATQQERNARTLTFKLRAMLQGMPNTRRVDMMAAWLRTALEAVNQSAVQVQQASKPMPASVFQPARKERAESAVED